MPKHLHRLSTERGNYDEKSFLKFKYTANHNEFHSRLFIISSNFMRQTRTRSFPKQGPNNNDEASKSIPHYFFEDDTVGYSIKSFCCLCSKVK